MRAGDLRYRVQLQRRTQTRDALNKKIDTWVNVLPGDGKIWASLKDISGHQFMAAGGTQNQVQTEIGIRYQAGVLPSMRILHECFAYDIEAVLDRDRRWLILMCKKGVSNG